MAVNIDTTSETYLRGGQEILLSNRGCPSYPVSLADIAAVLDTCPTDDLVGVRSISIVGPEYDGLKLRRPAYGRCEPAVPAQRKCQWPPGTSSDLLLFEHQGAIVLPSSEAGINCRGVQDYRFTPQLFNQFVRFHVLYHEIGHAKGIFEQGDASEQSADAYARQRRLHLPALPASVPVDFRVP